MEKRIPQAILLPRTEDSFHGEQQIVSWFRRIWKNMDMRKKSICIPEKLMFIH